MFLVQDSSPAREQRIQKLLAEDPSLSALLSVIHFEWTVRRSIMALGTSPNVDIRAKLDGCHGCKAYKNLWKEEVFPNVNQRLPDVVKDWDGLLKAFRLRHRLVHGVSSCGLTYATERVSWAIDACQNIRELCALHMKLIWMHVFPSAGVFEVEYVSLTLIFSTFRPTLL